MDVFALRDRLVEDYASYTRSFINIADPRIQCKVNTELDAGAFWPEPLAAQDSLLHGTARANRTAVARARCGRAVSRFPSGPGNG